MYGGKVAFQNRLCWLMVGRKFTVFLCITGLRRLYMDGLIFRMLWYYDHFEAEEIHIKSQE